jgi:hypothetical protein
MISILFIRYMHRQSYGNAPKIESNLLLLRQSYCSELTCICTFTEKNKNIFHLSFRRISLAVLLARVTFMKALLHLSKLLSLAILLLTTGCVSTYMPNVPNVPMFTEKGELSAAGHITPKGNVTFNTAYAVTDKIGVMVNGSMLNQEGRKRDFRHNLVEAGAGYFTTFGPNQNRVLEIYGGFGGGSSDRNEKKEREGVMTYTRREASFSKYFTQVNFSSKKKKSLRLLGNEFPLNYGTALRMSYLSMNKHLLNSVEQEKENNIFLEPIFFTRMTLSPTVQLQYTSGSNFGLRNRKALTAGYSVFSLGFVINVGGRNLDR